MKNVVIMPAVGLAQCFTRHRNQFFHHSTVSSGRKFLAQLKILRRQTIWHLHIPCALIELCDTFSLFQFFLSLLGAHLISDDEEKLTEKTMLEKSSSLKCAAEHEINFPLTQIFHKFFQRAKLSDTNYFIS